MNRTARRMRPALALLLIMGLVPALASIAPPGLSAAPGDVSEVRANQTTTNDQQEPTLAVDPTNPNNVIVAAKDWRTGPKQIWYYRSTDGGRTWADGRIDLGASELPNGSDPVLAFDAKGVLYISFIGYNQSDLTVGGIFVARSDDAGASWNRPVLVAAHSADVFNDKEWLTVDRSTGPNRGAVYVTWTLFSKEGQHERGDIVASRSTDGGKTFSPPKPVSLREQDANQGSFPVIGPSGDLYVLYFSDNPSMEGPTGRGIYLARSADGGQTFTRAVKAAPVSTPVSPLPGSKFRIFVLPALAVDQKSGALYATWNDFRNDDADVMLVHSTDRGQTWSAPLRVNNDPVKPRRDQFFPTVTVGSDGTVHMLWLDRRGDPENKRFVPFYASSTDGGKTFTQEPLSRTPSNPDVGFEGTLIGDYLAINTSADGSRVYAAWVDTRNGDQDIYFSAFANKPGPDTPDATPVKQPPVAVPSPQPLTGFSDAAFMRKWERTDRLVLLGKANRAWVWGPVGFSAAQEPYAQGKNGTRDVEYFDKARMEINNRNGDITNRFYVTNGLLVVELISGRIQTGDNQFEPTRPPAQIPVAGDADSQDALTYASFAPVASLNGDKRAPDRTGQGITSVLNKAGAVSEDAARAGSIRIAKYEPMLGHNIPDVFWAFMNQKGTVQLSDPGSGITTGANQEAEAADPEGGPMLSVNAQAYTEEPILDWVADLGYPISEAYWTNVKVAGVQKWVLVQAFQRRVLTYVADNPPGWQVEMGNVGRHYYDWRYNRR